MSSPPNLNNLTNFEIVTGRRKGSILYKSNSFLYYKGKTPTPGTFKNPIPTPAKTSDFERLRHPAYNGRFDRHAATRS